jgi:hypothetical protein
VSGVDSVTAQMDGQLSNRRAESLEQLDRSARCCMAAQGAGQKRGQRASDGDTAVFVRRGRLSPQKSCDGHWTEVEWS